MEYILVLGLFDEGVDKFGPLPVWDFVLLHLNLKAIKYGNKYEDQLKNIICLTRNKEVENAKRKE